MEKEYKFKDFFEVPADERDSIFSRLSYKEGTPNFEEYYTRRPEKLNFDNRLRARPFKGGETAELYRPLATNATEACFNVLSHWGKAPKGEINPVKTDATPEQFTNIIIGLAKYYGAKDVKIFRMEPEDYYAYRAKGEDYGKPVECTHKYGIMYCVEMEKNFIETAPQHPMALAVVKGYIDLAVIGKVVATAIKEYGYDAYAHSDSHYMASTPRLGQKSFLGELGKSGLLVTKEWGPRVRLGLITTDLELVETPKKGLYIREFCELCNRCKNNCPGRAIGDNLKDYNEDCCISMWYRFGTDCGVCMASCPFSYNLPKELIEDLSTEENRQKLAAYCDEHFPQKREQSSNYPNWIDEMYK